MCVCVVACVYTYMLVCVRVRVFVCVCVDVCMSGLSARIHNTPHTHIQTDTHTDN